MERNAAWLVKDWTSTWREPACNGLMVKKVVNSHEAWLSVFYPVDSRDAQSAVAYEYARLTWKAWKEVFSTGMEQTPSTEQAEAFEGNCKNFVMRYLLAFTSHRLPFYMHLLLTHAGEYMRFYGTVGKFRYAMQGYTKTCIHVPSNKQFTFRIVNARRKEPL